MNSIRFDRARIAIAPDGSILITLCVGNRVVAQLDCWRSTAMDLKQTLEKELTKA